MQYTLYLLALHRLLKSRLADYDYDRHVGGALYLFLRGIDQQAPGCTWTGHRKALIEALDAAFSDQPKTHGPDARLTHERHLNPERRHCLALTGLDKAFANFLQKCNPAPTRCTANWPRWSATSSAWATPAWT